MSIKNIDLFNLELLYLTKGNIRNLTQVTSLNIFIPSSTIFSPAGLFSNEIFGQVGSTLRNESFGYVDLHVNVLHPLVYSSLGSLRLIYKEIMAGNVYATFDDKKGDFELSDKDNGGTGYEFFMSNVLKLKLDDRGSDQRAENMAIVESYIADPLELSKWLVSPAGVRDYGVDENGVPKEDEVNDLYRRLMNTANVISNISVTAGNISDIDTIRNRLQLGVNALYTHWTGLMDGKRKFLQNEFAKRSVAYGSRNVLSPSIPNIMDYRDPGNVTENMTIMGLYQFTMSVVPVAINRIHETFMYDLMGNDSGASTLIDTKTLKPVMVDVSSKVRQGWMTKDGLSSKLYNLKQPSNRTMPVMVGDHYLAMIHESGGVVTVLDNREPVPEDFKKKDIRPITYYEMLFISLLPVIHKYPCITVRFPVINLGSVYVSKTHVRCNVVTKSTIVRVDGFEYETREYPNSDSDYYNGVSVGNSHIGPLGADFDGDQIGTIVLFTNESIAEVNALLRTKEFYISPTGELAYTPVDDIIEYVVKSMAK